MRTVCAGLLYATLLCASGCSILVGNVKPVTERSNRYQTMDMTQMPEWDRLGKTSPEGNSESDSNLTDPDVTEFAWQSKTTGAVVSLNSSCRAKFRDPNLNLQEFTEQLVLGTTDIAEKNVETISVSGQQALQTTFTGSVSGRTNRLRVVVVRVNDCIYDLMYVARPKHFNTHLDDFTKFVQAFRINP